MFHQNVPPEAPHVPAVKTCFGGFRPQVWHHYQDISLLLIFYRELKFEVGLFLGPLVYLFHQNVPPEAPHVLAVRIGVAPISWYLPFKNLLQRAQFWGPFLPRNSGLSISPKFATRCATHTSLWKVYDVNSSIVSQILSHFPLSIPAYIEVLTNQKRREKSPMSLQGYQPKRLGGHSWFLNRI